MRLLVLGSGGKLGQLLRASWPENPSLDVVWHCGSTEGFDILNHPQQLAETVADCNKVLMLAGVTQSLPDRPFSTNVALAQVILEAASSKPVLLASTAAVYGRHPGPLTEDIAQPVSDYGRSKHKMEQAAATFPNATCLRIGNIAGADALLGRSQPDQTLHQFPDGSFPVRSYIGPVTLAQTIAQLVGLKWLPRILNVASPDPISMADLLEAAGRPWRAVPAPESAIRRVHLDTTQLQALTPLPHCDAGSIIAELDNVQARL